MLKTKQIALKPQDLLIALKVSVNKERTYTFAELGAQLFMSASEVHAGAQRAEFSRLLRREAGGLIAISTSLREFLIHGVKYAFPASSGPIVRGVATGVGALPLKEFFVQTDELFPVWPDPIGQDRGFSLQPIYPAVPNAARVDNRLYELLALVDALRAGAAREREMAAIELGSRL